MSVMSTSRPRKIAVATANPTAIATTATTTITCPSAAGAT